MIGNIPNVLKINMQMNHVNCFLVPAFQSPIPFQIMSRIISIPNKNIVPLANTGVVFATSAAVCASIIYFKKLKVTCVKLFFHLIEHFFHRAT